MGERHRRAPSGSRTGPTSTSPPSSSISALAGTPSFAPPASCVLAPPPKAVTARAPSPASSVPDDALLSPSSSATGSSLGSSNPGGGGLWPDSGTASGNNNTAVMATTNASPAASPAAILTAMPAAAAAPPPPPSARGAPTPNSFLARSISYSGGSAGRSAASPRRSPDAQIRDRDDRIAVLQHELATMEFEFRRELDRLARSESETAAFWQAKHSSLNQQFLRADTDLRLLRADLDARDRAAAADHMELDGLRRDLRAQGEETRALRAQVRGLKEWVSTSTRAEGQTSDEVLGEAVARLANGLQNWVIVNFRRAKVDLAKSAPGVLRDLARLVPGFEALAGSAKIHLLQSVVSAVLVDMVFAPYFIGLTAEQTRQFEEMERLLASLTFASESVNHWRAATLSILRREGDQSTMQPQTDATIDTVIASVTRLLDGIVASANTPSTNNSATPSTNRATPPPTSASTSTYTSVSSTPTSTPTSTYASGPTTTAATPSALPSSGPDQFDVQALRQLVVGSVDLARQLASQRALFRVVMPLREALPPTDGPATERQRVLFDPVTMDDVGGHEDEELATREVSCVVFPGVIKKGDERGTQLHFENVIFKAKVLCSPE